MEGNICGLCPVPLPCLCGGTAGYSQKHFSQNSRSWTEDWSGDSRQSISCSHIKMRLECPLITKSRQVAKSKSKLFRQITSVQNQISRFQERYKQHKDSTIFVISARVSSPPIKFSVFTLKLWNLVPFTRLYSKFRHFGSGHRLSWLRCLNNFPCTNFGLIRVRPHDLTNGTICRKKLLKLK